jgi:general stress protein 26
MSTENLYHEEARKKIKELAESIDFTLMGTQLGTKPVRVIPMSTKKVDEKGNIWFLSGKDSGHNVHIRTDNKVQLFYVKPGAMEFLTVYGKATITTDSAVLEELYGKSDDMWFDGLDDPNLTAIEVHPLDAYYWDTKHNKVVSLLKMGAGAITGDQPDLSEQGELQV